MNSIPRTTILALLSNCRNFPFQSCETSLTCFTIRRIILLISNSIDSSVHANTIYFSFHFVRVERFYLPFNPNYESAKFQLSIIHYPSSSVTIPDKCIDSFWGRCRYENTSSCRIILSCPVLASTLPPRENCGSSRKKILSRLIHSTVFDVAKDHPPLFFPWTTIS